MSSGFASQAQVGGTSLLPGEKVHVAQCVSHCKLQGRVGAQPRFQAADSRFTLEQTQLQRGTKDGEVKDTSLGPPY